MSNKHSTIQILDRTFTGEEKLDGILLALAEYVIDKSIDDSYDLSMATAASKEVAK